MRSVPVPPHGIGAGADDLSMVELVMAYQPRIPDADAERFRQVQDVVDYLRRRRDLE